jgi:VanZ family protein
MILKRIPQKIYYWLPTILWMGVIFLFSSRPSLKTSTIDWQDFIIKKIAHFIEYYILASLLYSSLKRTSSLPRFYLLLLTITIAVFYAATDEYHQTFVAGREGRIRDVFIDSTGGLFSLLTVIAIGL